MNDSKKWEILHKSHISNLKPQNLEKILLANRGITTKKDVEEFLYPKLENVTADIVGINKTQLIKAIKRIYLAKQKKEKVIVYGDYDVDGITGTAILWETLHGLGLNVSPYIPDRIEEGYGLSVKGIENIISNIKTVHNDSPTKFQDNKIGLIITVDNGIVAYDAVEFAKKEGIDVIITDHHIPSEKLPIAYAIVHTTKVCGAGVAYLLSQEISSVIARSTAKGGTTKQSYIDKEIATLASFARNDNISHDHLALVALATVADLVPLTHANRTLLVFGLEVLKTTKRPGIVALCQDAQIQQKDISVYTIGHMLAPRLNAMGRIASAMDSLRLLCTKDRLRAKVLAEKLGITNRERQILTQALSDHAVLAAVRESDNVLLIAHESYEEGVIGLVAGKLVERYYRPSIVISLGEKISKASARSIVGFNIIEFIRSASHLLINAGGHPMAAGFTIETEKIALFKEFIQKNTKNFNKDLLTKTIKIDCELSLEFVSQKLFDSLQTLQPFGMNNPEPTFVSKAIIKDIKTVGQDGKHLKLLVSSRHSERSEESRSKNSNSANQHPRGVNQSVNTFTSGVSNFQAIAFGMGDRFDEFIPNQQVQIVYTIVENVWNNKKTLQLKIRDIRKTEN